MDDHLHLPSSASRLELKKGKKRIVALAKPLRKKKCNRPETNPASSKQTTMDEPGTPSCSSALAVRLVLDGYLCLSRTPSKEA
jgi:hypothetical protein